jgi:hypothetical protein
MQEDWAQWPECSLRAARCEMLDARCSRAASSRIQRTSYIAAEEHLNALDAFIYIYIVDESGHLGVGYFQPSQEDWAGLLPHDQLTRERAAGAHPARTRPANGALGAQAGLGAAGQGLAWTMRQGLSAAWGAREWGLGSSRAASGAQGGKWGPGRQGSSRGPCRGGG